MSYTADHVRRCAEESARVASSLAHRLGTGFGVLQVERCFARLLARAAPPYAIDVSFSGRSPGAVDKPRGIYLRSAADTNGVMALAMSLRLRFRKDADALAQCAVERRIALRCAADWVALPAFAILTASGKDFAVRVDTTALERDRVHFTEIVGHDVANDGWRSGAKALCIV